MDLFKIYFFVLISGLFINQCYAMQVEPPKNIQDVINYIDNLSGNLAYKIEKIEQNGIYTLKGFLERMIQEKTLQGDEFAEAYGVTYQVKSELFKKCDENQYFYILLLGCAYLNEKVKNSRGNFYGKNVIRNWREIASKSEITTIKQPFEAFEKSIQKGIDQESDLGKGNLRIYCKILKQGMKEQSCNDYFIQVYNWFIEIEKEQQKKVINKLLAAAIIFGGSSGIYYFYPQLQQLLNQLKQKFGKQ